MNLDKNIQKFPKDDDLFFYGAHSNFLWNKFIKDLRNKKPEIFFNPKEHLISSDKKNSSGPKKARKRTWIEKMFDRIHKHSLINKSNVRNAISDGRIFDYMLYGAKFIDYRAERFEIESALPHTESPLDITLARYSASLEIANSLIGLLSSPSKIESKCVLLSRNHTNLFISNQLISEKTRVRFLFSAKFLSQVIITTILSNNKALSLVKAELSYRKPFDYIPYILAEEIFPKSLKLTSRSNCKKTCYFINLFPKIITNSQTDGNLVKKIVSIQKLFKDEKITDNEFKDFQLKFDENISFEVECNLDYDEEADIINISFGDELLIDCWLGHDSVFFSFPNFLSSCYILKLFSADASNKELIGSGNFIQDRNYYIELNKTLKKCYSGHSENLNKKITLTYYPNNQKNSISLYANYYLLNKFKQEETKFTPSADLGYYASQIKKEQEQIYGDLQQYNYSIINKPLGKIRAAQNCSIINFKKGRLIRDEFKWKRFRINPHKEIMQSIIDSAFHKSSSEYQAIIDSIFSLMKDRERIEYISNTNSRAFYFSVLEAICIFFDYDTNNTFSSISLCNFIESCKQNIIYIDQIKLDQRKREEEAKLLVRNLRHSINNTSEAVLANLKEAIEIVNKKGADNQNTLNHLYSCNDEVAALRNTVLKFCHDIIDQDSISSLYHDSYTVGKGDNTITFKEILYSSLFMAIKQIIKNIRFKTIREAYQKEKNISLRDELLFNKFKDYIGLKYHRSFAELTFEELLSDKILYKDYSSYVFKVAASSEFDNLYNVFVQKRDFNSINSFLEKYFFSVVNIELSNADLSVREASYASYLLTDLLNEVCLNTLKYSLPNSSLKVLQSTHDDYLEIKILNEANTRLKGSFGSGTGLSGQQTVVNKIGGYIEKAQDPTTNQFSLTVKLPIHG